ncbi:MAG: glycosyltransferase family 2 protein [Candidatus Pacebacteria bacterium]|nr:glycosyltransferase family 2 protein [Candidatus Paceibacterota bacterium]
MHNQQHIKSAISVLIPSFNGIALLQKHLPSVIEQLVEGDEIVIIDDGSSDGTQDYIKQKLRHAQVHVHRINENVRFARAVNNGVAVAKNNFIFLCNNDVQLAEDCLNTVRSYTQDETVFAVGCLEYEEQPGGEKSGKNKLWFSRGLFQHSKANDFSSGETAWASGGSALFSKLKWNKLGGFDEHFAPAYWEDVDLSFRARKRGWKVLFDEKAIVLHKHETTNASVFGKLALDETSWQHGQYFTWKHASIVQKLAFIMWWPYWFVLRMSTS